MNIVFKSKLARYLISIGIFLGSLSGIATLKTSLFTNEVNASSSINNYFTEDYLSTSIDESKTKFYLRTSGDTATVSNGECIVSVNNSNFGTSFEFSNYIATFRMYNAAESRIEFVIGNTDPANKGYASGNNCSSDNLIIMLTNTFVRTWVNGTKQNDKTVSSSLTTSTYSDIELKVNNSEVRLRVNGTEVWSVSLSSSLPAGKIVLARGNLSTEYHIDSIRVESLEKFFNEKFDNSSNTEMILYNRSGSGNVTIANGISTFTTLNDSYSTRGEYLNNFCCDVRMKNDASNGDGRIGITIGGPTSPSSKGYSGNSNYVDGVFGFFILQSQVRWLENNSTINQYNVSTGLEKTNYMDIKFQVKDFVFTLWLNNNKLFEHSLNQSTFVNPGQIIFHRADSSYEINYVFDSIKVSSLSTIKQNVEINGIYESDSSLENSCFRISLSGSDYGSKSQTIVNDLTLNSLNFANKIRLNGELLANDLVYQNNQKYINIGNYANSFGFRKSGNQAGYIYTDPNNGKSERSSDGCIYEVEIASGCEFISYATVSGEALVETIYVTNKDYVFVWFNGQFQLSDSFNYPKYKDIRIMNVSFTDKGGTNKSLNLEFDNFNWPTLGNGDDKFENIDVHLKQPCLTLRSRISINTNNGANVVVSTGEVFINLWGNGVDNPTLSVRISDNLSINNIDSIVIYEGCEFPSYNNYLHGTNELYKLKTTTRFLSSHDGVFYKASDLSAVEFAKDFYYHMGQVCYSHDIDGDELTKTKLEVKFSVYKKIYDNLPSNIKTDLSNSSDPEVIQMFERYNFIVNKYHFNDDTLNYFLSSNYSSSNKESLNVLSAIDYSTIIVSIAALISICGLVYVKRRKSKGSN